MAEGGLAAPQAGRGDRSTPGAQLDVHYFQVALDFGCFGGLCVPSLQDFQLVSLDLIDWEVCHPCAAEFPKPTKRSGELEVVNI